MEGEVTPRRRAPRRDARERREALIVAAAELFARDGYGVALESIADRAGVGRGTLYRNFSDREAIALAIFSREVDRLEAILDPDRPVAETMAAMVRDGAPAAALFMRIAVELGEGDPHLPAFVALGERLEAIVEPLVRAAQRRGEFAASVTPRQVVLAMRMAGGLLLPFMTEDDRAANLDAALTLVLDGMRPR